MCTYSKFGIFRDGIIFTKLGGCEVSWNIYPREMTRGRLDVAVLFTPSTPNR